MQDYEADFVRMMVQSPYAFDGTLDYDMAKRKPKWRRRQPLPANGAIACPFVQT